MQPREKMPYQKASEIQNKTDCGVCKGSLVPLVPGRNVGCICEEGEWMEEEYHSPRSFLGEFGRHCVPISPCPCDTCQERIQNEKGNMLIKREFSINIQNSYCGCFVAPDLFLFKAGGRGQLSLRSKVSYSGSGSPRNWILATWGTTPGAGEWLNVRGLSVPYRNLEPKLPLN